MSDALRIEGEDACTLAAELVAEGDSFVRADHLPRHPLERAVHDENGRTGGVPARINERA